MKSSNRGRPPGSFVPTRQWVSVVAYGQHLETSMSTLGGVVAWPKARPASSVSAANTQPDVTAITAVDAVQTSVDRVISRSGPATRVDRGKSEARARAVATHQHFESGHRRL